MTKIVLVGDNRPALNFGSIATTDTLLKLLHNCSDDISIIDYRSFSLITPPAGFPPFRLQHSSNNYELGNYLISLKGLISPYVPLFLKNRLKRSRHHLLKLPISACDFDPLYKEALNSSLPAYNYEVRLLKSADHVIINAEGAFVNGTDSDGIYRRDARYLCFIAYLASKLSKKVHIVNNCVDPCCSSGLEMIKLAYQNISSASVREPLSKQLLADNSISSKFVPDTLFTYDVSQLNLLDNPLPSFKGASPYICLGDSATIGKINLNIKTFYPKLVSLLKKQVCENIVFVDGFYANSPVLPYVRDLLPPSNIISLRTHSYHDLIKVISDSSLLLSGRWHTSIMAAITGTPFVLWGSDSHKTKALSQMYAPLIPYFNSSCLAESIDDLVQQSLRLYSCNAELSTPLRTKSLQFSSQASHLFDFIGE